MIALLGDIANVPVYSEAPNQVFRLVNKAAEVKQQSDKTNAVSNLTEARHHQYLNFDQVGCGRDVVSRGQLSPNCSPKSHLD